MCDRTPLFLIEAKSIISELLKRTLELLDLFIHFTEYQRLHQYLADREIHRDYPLFSLHHSCKLNYTIISDLDKYFDRLSTSCRLTKSQLRLLYAARLKSSNDYIVIDDVIYDSIKSFQRKLRQQSRQFQSQLPTSDHLLHTRYQSQRQIHSSHTSDSFIFHPETSDDKNNSHMPVSSNEILQSFEKIARLYDLLLQRLYGIHFVRDSDILQAIAIHIIRLLLSITKQLRADLPSIPIHPHHFLLRQNDQICQAEAHMKTKYHLLDHISF